MWLLGVRSPNNLVDDNQRMIGRAQKKLFYKYTQQIEKDTEFDPDSLISTLNNKFKSTETLPSLQDRALAFFDMETHKLSMLVPEIRFYKVVNNALVPFYFPIVSDFDPLENSSAEFTGYVGGNTVIDNFSVVFEGQDFFTSSRYIKCNLTLKIDSLANIFIEKPGYARLADLFTFSTQMVGSQNNAGGKALKAGQLRKQNEIAVILAYSSIVNQADIFTDKERDEIEKNFLSLRMYPGDHTINVEQDGSANIDIEFTAFIDSSRLDNASLIENPTDMFEKAAIRAALNSKTIKNVSSLSSQDDADKLSAAKRRQKKVIEIQNEIRKVTEILEQKERLFSLDILPGLLQLYSFPNHLKGQSQEDESTLPTVGYTKPALPADEPASSTDAKIESKTLLEKLEASSRTLYFFTFRDMVEAFFLKKEQDFLQAHAAASNDEKAAKEIQEDFDNFKKMVIIFGNVTISFDDGKTAIFNIGELPVSVDIYQQYIFNEVVNIADKKYTIKKFLEDSYKVILEEVFSSFEEAAPFVIKNTDTSFAGVSYTGAKLKSRLQSSDSEGLSPEQIPGPLDGGVAASIPRNSFEIDKINNEKEYFIIYSQTNIKVPSSTKLGNRKQDLKKGIYHFDLGKDRGLIKSINFSKFDIQYRREGLMVGQIGIYDELKMPYHANITMFGNMMFFPGSQIYIDPFSIGFGDPRDENSAAANLGLGGYYTVLKVSTTYTNEGNLTTSLECSYSSPTKQGAATIPTKPSLVTGNPPVNSMSADASALSEDNQEVAPPPGPPTRGPVTAGSAISSAPSTSTGPTPMGSPMTQGLPPSLRPTQQESQDLESGPAGQVASGTRRRITDSGGSSYGDN